jgi:hypothetical protein
MSTLHDNGLDDQNVIELLTKSLRQHLTQMIWKPDSGFSPLELRSPKLGRKVVNQPLNLSQKIALMTIEAMHLFPEGEMAKSRANTTITK